MRARTAKRTAEEAGVPRDVSLSAGIVVACWAIFLLVLVVVAILAS